MCAHDIPQSATSSAKVWRPDDDHNVDSLVASLHEHAEHSDVLDAIESCIESASEDLRKLSIRIHDLPELKFEEKHAHDALTEFIEKAGFTVERHYLLPTAWKATYARGNGGRTIGINSEMDALPGVGHACGHNLIAIAGVAVALAIKAAMEKLDVAGTIVLLGTPGEEMGFGKDILFEKGAYEGMDACLMCHPAPGPPSSVSLSSCLALVRYEVKYSGHAWIVRAPLMADARETAKRVTACFEAAALASGCKVTVTELAHPAFDLRQNTALGAELAGIVQSRYGFIDYEWGIKDASTDFGRISYAIPTEDNGGNHTPAFTESARTVEAHKVSLNVSKALAGVGIKVLMDEDFARKVKESFEEDKKQRGAV
ncbi:hypothetical protein HWV62_23118 [Athelia sp. TMB]|nr:hypothetical protein HWV62_23118 [Athelia sp. TMB]